MSKGKICLLASAFLYGIAPMLSKLTYIGGANGITLTFLRAMLSTPVLYAMLRADKKSLKLTGHELKGVILLGIFGMAAPIILLNFSYDFISTGLATTLHFIYPLIIVLASALLYHEKMSTFTMLAVVFVTIGIFLFADIEKASDNMGIMLSLLSGVFYSFYVIYVEHSGLENMDYIKLTFYLMLIMGIVSFLFGILTQDLSFRLTGEAWSFATIISLMISLGAIPLFQAGVKYEGATTAGIMSTFEPIASIVLGSVFLGETVGLSQVFGVAVIIAGIIILNIKPHPVAV